MRECGFIDITRYIHLLNVPLLLKAMLCNHEVEILLAYTKKLNWVAWLRRMARERGEYEETTESSREPNKLESSKWLWNIYYPEFGLSYEGAYDKIIDNLKKLWAARILRFRQQEDGEIEIEILRDDVSCLQIEAFTTRLVVIYRIKSTKEVLEYHEKGLKLGFTPYDLMEI